MGSTFFIIALTILYVVEVVFHEKDKNKLKEYEKIYEKLEKEDD